MFDQGLGVRGLGFLFAVYVVVVLLMPARYLFGLTGAGLCGVGVYYLATDPGRAMVAFGLGVMLIGFCVRTIIRERRKADTEARLAEEDARRMTGDSRRPRL